MVYNLMLDVRWSADVCWPKLEVENASDLFVIGNPGSNGQKSSNVINEKNEAKITNAASTDLAVKFQAASYPGVPWCYVATRLWEALHVVSFDSCLVG